MLLIGLAFLLDWLLIMVFAVEDLKAALITAVVFIIAGLLLEGVPNFRRNP